MNTKESDILSEYRALTIGGVIAGSQTFTRGNSNQTWTFTAPVGATKVLANGYYISVTAGNSYSVYYSTGTIGANDYRRYSWTVAGTTVSSGGNYGPSSITVSWSNDINNHS